MRPLLREYSASALSGMLLALAFPKAHFFPLAWIGLVPLLVVSLRRTPRQAAAHFLLAGWLFHTIVLQWLMTNIYWAGGWALIGQQLVCVALSLFWAALGFIWVTAATFRPRLLSALSLALLWYLMEWLQGNLFTGFGWCALGYTQGHDLPLAQWASIGNVWAVSFLLALVNALLALAWTHTQWRYVRIAAVVAVVALAHLAGWLMLDIPQQTLLTAGIVQPNFSQEMKWDQEYWEEMVRNAAKKSAALAAARHVDLFVWPEALVMEDFNKPQLLGIMADLARDTSAGVLTGAEREDRLASKSYNSMALIDEHGLVNEYYDKVHLAPFGEYVPYEKYLPFLRQIVIGGVDFGAQQKVFHFKDHVIGPLICFEVLFPHMSEKLRADGAQMLAVITNLAWFGLSNAIPQELEIARFRAIETRLPLIHSANTGISGVFDPWGRFHGIDGTISPGGQYREWPIALAEPDITIMRRMVGAVPVPPPAPRVCPFSPGWMIWVVVAALAALATAAWRLPASKAQ